MAEKKTKKATAQKRDLQNKKRALQNHMFASKVRTAIRQYKESVSQKEKDEMEQRMKLVYSLLDKGTKRGLWKIHKASRIKSRLTKKAQLSLVK